MMGWIRYVSEQSCLGVQIEEEMVWWRSDFLAIGPQELDRSDTVSTMVMNERDESNHLERLAIGK